MSENITIDKQYFVCAANKKCTTVSDSFVNSDGETIWLEKVYRSGSFFITPKDQDEVEALEWASEDGGDIDVDDFQEWELDHLYDLCADDIMGDIEKIGEEVFHDVDEDWLIENGYNNVKTLYTISDGIVLSEA